MKVTIRSNRNITSEEVKNVIDDLNEKYSSIGLQVKNMTMYVRFADETGATVEPVENGSTIERTYTYQHSKEADSKKAKEKNKTKNSDASAPANANTEKEQQSTP